MMRRLLLALLLLWPSLASADDLRGHPVQTAQMLQMIVQDAPQHSAGCTGYTGPGDIVTFTAWGGLRAYSCATRNTAVANVCLNDGTTCADVLSDATTGIPPNAPVISGTTCNNTTQLCQIKTLYDQTGNGHNFTQATAGNRPVWVTSCQNSQGCMDMPRHRLLSNSFTINQPLTMVFVFNRSAQGAVATDILSDDIVTASNFDGTNGKFQVQSGNAGVYGNEVDGQWHEIQVVFNGASSVVTVEGTSQAAINPGANHFSGAASTGTTSATTSTWREAEVGIAAGTVSGSTLTSLSNNMKAAWGL